MSKYLQDSPYAADKTGATLKRADVTKIAKRQHSRRAELQKPSKGVTFMPMQLIEGETLQTPAFSIYQRTGSA